MTHDREFYTIFVVDKRTIRYFCGRKPNDIETDEEKEVVTFPPTGIPYADKPVFLLRDPNKRNARGIQSDPRASV